MDIRFVTKNSFKVSEVQKILTNAKVLHAPISIKEIQTEDIHEIVNDKIIKAFRAIGRPVFIEHTSLYLRGLNGLPGGLTQIFWDKLQAEKFAELASSTGDPAVTAVTVIAYCDGKSISSFEGSSEGSIAPTPRGSRDFQWDCIFVPNGYSETFAEMGDKKNDISMRRIAFEKFNSFLGGK